METNLKIPDHVEAFDTMILQNKRSTANNHQIRT